MMKKLLWFFLLPFPVFADVTWVQATQISSLAVSTASTTIYTAASENMTLTNKNGAIATYQTYCSTDQKEAESSAGEGTTRSTIGEFAWSSFPTNANNASSVSSSAIGMLRGDGINRQTYTLYCLLHLPGIPATDASLTVTGLIIPADLATVPKPFLELSQTEINLGTCRVGDKLQKGLPSLLSYKGYAAAHTSSLAWSIANDAGNPDGSTPVISVANSEISPVDVPLQQDPFDAGINISYLCSTPGNYKWNMTLTYTIE